jgi:AcrR family transcriptional regulator
MIGQSKQNRSEITRRRVLEAAIDAFGSRGFEGTSTRELVDRAGVNLVAIHYHFGGKEALYRRAAEHIADTIRERGRAGLGRARAAATRPDTTRAELIECICELFDQAAAFTLADLPESWRRFLIREQVEPTGAFDVMFRAIRPFFQVASTILGRLIGRRSSHPEVRLLTMMIFGQLSVFRTNRAAALRLLGWRRVGPPELEQVRETARKYIMALLGESRSTPFRTAHRRRRLP